MYVYTYRFRLQRKGDKEREYCTIWGEDMTRDFFLLFRVWLKALEFFNRFEFQNKEIFTILCILLLCTMMPNIMYECFYNNLKVRNLLNLLIEMIKKNCALLVIFAAINFSLKKYLLFK